MEKLYEKTVGVFQDVFKDTIKKVPEGKYSFLVNHWTILFEIESSLMKEIGNKVRDYILFIRLLELCNKQSYWLQFNILSGAYYSSIRELRFVLESAIQAYYIDKKYPKIENKLGLKEIDGLYGIGLLERTDFDKKDKNILRGLYHELSEYVHSTKEEFKDVEEAMLRGEVDRFWQRIINDFDKDLFYKCVEFTNRTLDAFYFVFLSLFPKIALKIKDDQTFMKLLNELKSELTIKYVNEVVTKG